MEKRHDIKGILFNFSGTIDTEGSDWFDLIWKEYREIGIPITKSDYLAAHEFAEKEISEKGLIEPWFNFYFTTLWQHFITLWQHFTTLWQIELLFYHTLATILPHFGK